MDSESELESRPGNLRAGEAQNNEEAQNNAGGVAGTAGTDAARENAAGSRLGLSTEEAVAARTKNAAGDESINPEPPATNLADFADPSDPTDPADLTDPARVPPPGRETVAAREALAGREVAPDDEAAPDEERQSLFEAIAEANAAEDGVPKTRKDEGGKRWTLGTSLAPVYYNSFGDGSPISQNFVSNSKSGTMNFSYGVSVGYAVTDRLSLRSGLNRVDFGYNTNQVAFTSTLSGPSSASLIRTISYSENARTVVVESTARNGTPAMDNTTADVNAQTPAREGRMLQEFGYLEVPVEMEYRLVDKKLGVNLVGGMSSLFLVDNSVSLDSDGATTQIGEATNMNSVSFSTNLGLGVFYNLNRELQLEVQPMFKYHLNTFSNTAGNFQPYSVGVYSGIRYRF